MPAATTQAVGTEGEGSAAPLVQGSGSCANSPRALKGTYLGSRHAKGQTEAQGDGGEGWIEPQSTPELG